MFGLTTYATYLNAYDLIAEFVLLTTYSQEKV